MPLITIRSNFVEQCFSSIYMKAFNILDILLHPEFLVGPRKNLQNKGSQKAGKPCFEINFCK